MTRYDFALAGLLAALVLISYRLRGGKVTKTLWTGNEITPAAKKQIEELQDRCRAIMQGQEALKAQTVRIRKAALGGEPDPGAVDTEKLVADLRANYDRLCELTEE